MPISYEDVRHKIIDRYEHLVEMREEYLKEFEEIKDSDVREIIFREGECYGMIDMIEAELNYFGNLLETMEESYLG
jgi:23S rRNA maturation-related 3'-5' exoribonuclease YhaM